jgi:hypothetical protein
MYSNYTRLSCTRGIASTNYAKFFSPDDAIYNESPKVNYEGDYKYKEFYEKDPGIESKKEINKDINKDIKKEMKGGGCNRKNENDRQKDIVKRMIVLEEHLLHSRTTNKDYILRQCVMTESLFDDYVTDEIIKEKFKRISNSLFYDVKNNSLDNHKCYSYAQSIKDVRVRLFKKI